MTAKTFFFLPLMLYDLFEVFSRPWTLFPLHAMDKMFHDGNVGFLPYSYLWLDRLFCPVSFFLRQDLCLIQIVTHLKILKCYEIIQEVPFQGENLFNKAPKY